MAGVYRYAWKSINRHRVEDRDDAVQQVCLEWLLLAATVATTYDDVRRIVARVLDRAYRRLKKQEGTLDLLDVPVHADPVQDVFRDMQLDRDLGIKDLTEQEWHVVGLRRQGYTFAEIGEQIGMRKQRVREMFNYAASFLRRRYRD
jgi:DNA-directed RNA polymerase sigma subunit (sigma70/sigma32)